MDFGGIDPGKAGFATHRLAGVSELLEEGIEQELYPGAVLWVARDGTDALLHSTGHTDFSRTTPVDENTLYDLASLTKPLATASSMLLLCQDGLVHLGQCVADCFPDRSLPHLRDVTLRHLLTHTSGLPPWVDLYSRGQSREQAVDELFRVPLDREPGTHYAYSCLGYIILGLAIERIAGIGLDCFAAQRIFDPLCMHSTAFNPKPDSDTSVATTANCPLRKRLLSGEVHDGNAWAMGGVSGNAGLFSSTADLARFCRAIAFKTSPSCGAPFGPGVINLMFTNALSERLGGQTMGWFIHPNDMLPGGDFVSKAAIGHSGFAGTAIIIDPMWKITAVFLTNRVCGDDDGTRFRHLRRRVFNGIIGALEG